MMEPCELLSIGDTSRERIVHLEGEGSFFLAMQYLQEVLKGEETGEGEQVLTQTSLQHQSQFCEHD